MTSYEQFLTAVTTVNIKKVCRLIHEINVEEVSKTFPDIIHQIISTARSYETENSKSRSELVLILIDAGFSVDNLNKDSVIPLELAVRYSDAQTCRVLLQCGANMHHLMHDGVSVLDHVTRIDSNVSPDVKSVFKVFQPGLWEAVRLGDVELTRKLVNLWCRTDLCKDGKTLKDVALDSGIEGIISLILNIEPSMKLVHHVLTENVAGVDHILNTRAKYVNLNIRNMNDGGAPILFYAIEKQNYRIIRSLRKYGCRLFALMQDSDGIDMPVFFSALKPETTAEVMQNLLIGDDVGNILCRMSYKGMSVVEVAINVNLKDDTFDSLIGVGGPTLISNRNVVDECAREYAGRLGKLYYVNIIDRHVHEWLSKPSKHPGKRENLALFGYENFDCLCSHIVGKNCECSEFLHNLRHYQDQIKSLCSAVENGDVSSFQSLMTYNDDGQQNLFAKNLCWDARSPGEGLPLLHRAVIFKRADIVRLILANKLKSQAIDKLFDQFNRTAAHYAFALRDADEVINSLMDCGCSEHTLDKNGIEPLDFKLKKYTQEMDDLLSKLKNHDYRSKEPDPWSVVCKVNTSTSDKRYSMQHHHSHVHHIFDSQPSSNHHLTSTSSSCFLL